MYTIYIVIPKRGMQMKLSYIVPVYKVEQYIRQCVDSIMNQTMDDYEVILVDDGSPDNCPAICDEYKEKYPDIIKVIHKENGGLASARNAGLRNAVGDYIFFVDSDDYLFADRVSELMDKAVEYDADVLQTTYMSYDEKDNVRTLSSPAFSLEKVFSHDEMEREICLSNKKNRVIFVWRNIYRRKFLEDNEIYFEEKLRMIEDAPFNTLAFLKAKRFAAVDIPVYCYRFRDGSLQRRKYIENYDLFLSMQTDIKIKYYTENSKPQKAFFEDLAEHIIVDLFPILLMNIYINSVPERFKILKRIGNSEMMRRSFKDYDIKRFKSKSLDWWMTWCVKNKLYLLAHLICEKVLYKSK